MNYPHRYQQPPQRPSSGSNVLVIVLIVLVVTLVLGGGGCLLCIGLAASVNDTSDAAATVTAEGGPLASGPLERTELARQIEQKMKAEGVSVQSIFCPRDPTGSFTCELVALSGDRADVIVTPGATGLRYDVPGTAFLDGSKLTKTFQGVVASINPRLRAPCFTGTLMKKVGSSFTCDVLDGSAPAGKVTVNVLDAAGGVRMTYEGPRPGGPVPTGTPKARTVDFVCPAGKPPGGAVRGGCVCGSEILGTACGAPGNFSEVTETPTGCRFVCN